MPMARSVRPRRSSSTRADREWIRNGRTRPYAHSIIVSPDNRHAYAADLGLDQILGYGLDAATAKLTPLTPPFVATTPGAGPRHLTFHPDGKHLYAIDELSNTVTRYAYAADTGALTREDIVSTLPEDFEGTSYTADLKITPNGKFLYGTNRGHDSIAIFRIGDGGALTRTAIEPSLGKGPQNLAITPDGKWLLCANMPGNNLAVFAIDAETGALKAAGDPVEIVSPSCIRLLP
jgi:6-phosphogluconolactonase